MKAAIWNHTVYGLGQTNAEALTDAAEWLDHDEQALEDLEYKSITTRGVELVIIGLVEWRDEWEDDDE